MGRLILGLCGAMAALVGGLQFAAHQHQFGSEAKSPQTATIMMGTRVFVAGGKARLWYAFYDDMGPHVEAECGKGSEMVSFNGDEPVETGCGVTLTHLDTEEVRRGVWRSKIRVDWE